MRNLALEEGALVHLQSASLPIATFVKFEPQSTEFLEIRNPGDVLAKSLENIACLTKGDVIEISHSHRRYDLRVLEVRPGDAVSITDCEMEIDFAPPVGCTQTVSQLSPPTTGPVDKKDVAKPAEGAGDSAPSASGPSQPDV